MLDQNINTGGATGRLLFNMLGAVAQFETGIRAERQMDGIQKAKERGVHFDRQIAELQNRQKQGTLLRTLMADYHIPKATVYRYLNETNASSQ